LPTPLAWSIGAMRDTQDRINAVLKIRSAPSTAQRHLNKKIIGGLLLIAAVIFSASIISSIFS